MTYFRLKKELNWSLRDNGIIVYEGNKKLQLAINTDKNTDIFLFFKFLSDFKSEQEIADYPKLTAVEKKDTLNYLKSKNFLQSFDTPTPLTRTDTFLNCFPNTNFVDFKTYAEACTIVIIGLGTVGSHALDMLVRIGFQHFIIIDGDIVEEKNLYAQSYFVSDIGNLKVDVMKKRYRVLADVKTVPHCITPIQLHQITNKLKKEDIIINAADDYTLMKKLAQSIMENKLACKVIESGYGPLLQTAYVVDSFETAKLFSDYIEDITKLGNNNINENSGSIMNGYMSAFMIGQLIISPFVNKKIKVAEHNFVDDCLKWKEEV
ncbi:Ubiquitin-activating enzyme E1 1 [Streptococcus gallolyticus]|uniref:Ubiquitin-activating enzyme E1 1 n=1 Tax=Streptococcus gallolyticus TaxID=315405 RepID=A0AA94M0Q9_9STRE|nr:ThiF family adenylyltransferase [Streptococcus gallolyticus]AQP41119.1 putative cytoplasmatic protein [Streptococcus gallolyticus subsp. gallolyticus DSM 16831]SQG78398.1 Ubiquitin-activating enzyme E1 1 [Streptococcus gallolyticus]